MKTGFYQTGPDFSDVPEDIYEASLSVVVAEWAKFAKKTQKEAKKKKPKVIHENTERQSLPAWASNDYDPVNLHAHQSLPCEPSAYANPLLESAVITGNTVNL